MDIGEYSKHKAYSFFIDFLEKREGEIKISIMSENY